MKYFTMEELDYIAKELVENPSKETLKRLNDKYNGEEISTKNLNWVESPEDNNPVVTPEHNSTGNNSPMLSLPETRIENVSNFSVPVNESKQVEIPVKEEVPAIPTFDEENGLKTPVWNPEINTNNTLFNASINTQKNSTVGTPTMPDLNIQETPQNYNAFNFELPKTYNTQNINNNQSLGTVNNQVPFNGNLWETPNTGINNMMQTTDNFNTPIEQTLKNEVPIAQEPFFQTNMNSVNNQIPVSEPPKVDGPTMFGQFEQNFTSNAA